MRRFTPYARELVVPALGLLALALLLMQVR